MDRLRIIILIDKVFAKEASAAEQQELDRLYQQYDARLGYTDELDDVQLNTYKELFYSGIYERIKVAGITHPVHRVHPLWPRVLRITGIAAAVAAITLGIWLYYASNLNTRHPEPTLSSRVSRDLNNIAPGSNKATITLANGKTIQLSDMKTGIVVGNDRLAYNDGSTVGGRHPDLEEAAKQIFSGSRTEKATMLTASTPRGGTYQVTLPDGTRVWLNADSKISFPSQFSGKERKILLSGEAYFEVTKNKKMPFIVESKGQWVEVLGTHFNINSYADEGGTKTTLLEGSVKVSSLLSSRVNDLSSRTLRPNQQSVLTGSNQINVKQVDPEGAISWKLGYFMFNETPLEVAMKQISRWYNVEVVYEDPEVKSVKLGGSASRYDNVARILKTIENTGAVKFKISERKIIVLK